MDRLQAMEVFIRVVDTGTFTRAAQVLRMPKATVTTLIQNLESHLGAKLLNRTTRRVSVTPDGAAYYERCRSILADIEETEGALGHQQSHPRGRLRIDVPVTFGRRVLVPALPDFFARYPDIRLEVGCSDRAVDLIEEGVDCVVRGGVQPDSTLVARRISMVELVACATPEYLARHGGPTHPTDLARHRCVTYFSAKTGRILRWNFTKDGERIELQPEGFISLNDSEAYLEAGLAGLGIVQAAKLWVKDALADGRLQRVLPDWQLDTLPVWIMYPQNRHLSVKVRVFVDWVAELVAARAARRTGARAAETAAPGAAAEPRSPVALDVE
jgi:LysR family transcriptional regulator, regulator for bpeEF and oprC